MDYLEMMGTFDVEMIMAQLGAFTYVIAAVGLFQAICMAVIFHKAGKPWWAILIPIYNTIVGIQVCSKPWWWLFLLLIPVANIVFAIMLMVGFVKSFGKPGGHFWLLLLFSPIYIPYIAFSKRVKHVNKMEEAKAA